MCNSFAEKRGASGTVCLSRQWVRTAGDDLRAPAAPIISKKSIIAAAREMEARLQEKLELKAEASEQMRG